MNKKRDTRMCSRKKRFKDKSSAKKVVRNILRESGDELRYYECPICKGYHLTSLINEGVLRSQHGKRREVSKRGRGK